MSFTVTGVFRERTLRELPLRHFNRMFVVVLQVRRRITRIVNIKFISIHNLSVINNYLILNSFH